MKWFQAFVLTCILLCCPDLMASEPIKVKVSMRDSGYMMGDFMHQRVTFNLPKSLEIDSQSLPLPGRVNGWLDLHQFSMKRQGEQVTLELMWHLFATVETAQVLQTPAFQIKTKQQPVLDIAIPSVGFHYSPMFSMPLDKVTRKRDFPPTPFDETTPLKWLVIFGILSLWFGTVYLWLKDRLPWWPYQAGPLTKLARRIHRKSEDDIVQHHMIDVFHALNEAAGQSIYPKNIQVLYARAPYLNDHAAQIDRFVETAWKQLYEYRPLQPTNNQHTSATLSSMSFDWVKHAATAERLHRRMQPPIESILTNRNG